jgi:hypothetical protein
LWTAVAVAIALGLVLYFAFGGGMVPLRAGD